MALLRAVCIGLPALFGCVIGTHSNAGKCKIRCGVINAPATRTSWPEIVTAAWAEILQKENLRGVEIQFVPITQRPRLTMDDLIGVYMEMGTSNVTALVGPHVPSISTASQKFNIPYFMTTSPSYLYQRPFNLISVLPTSTQVVTVIVEIVKKYGWTSVGIVFDNNFGVRLVEEMTGVPSVHTRSWRIDKEAIPTKIREELLIARQWGVRHFILAVSPSRVDDVLDQALRLSMLTSRYSWVIALLTQEDIDLQPYVYTQVNLTTLRLVRGDFKSLHQASLRGSLFEYATVWDTLLTLDHAIREHYDYSGTCHWIGKYIPIILKRINVKQRGATGDLTYWDNGLRRGYNLDILSLDDKGLYTVGHWNSTYSKAEERLVIHGSKNATRGRVDYLAKRTIKVVSILEEPFVQLKADYQLRKGNDKFEGYCIDLLNGIAEHLKFNFELYLVHDEKYGSQQPDGRWDGIVGELMVGNASMAMASLTINVERETVIDFSKPFMALGISMLMKKPREESHIFQFMYPLSPLIWYLLLGALVLLSITLYIIDKVVRQKNEPVRFDASESMWFVYASLVQAGTEVIPRTLSSRILTASIWFFALILVSSYTANLAAFLTVTTINTPVESVSDLVGQTKVKYGTVRGTQCSAFFEHSKISHFQKMWTHMSAVDPESMVDSSEEGCTKVKESNGNYVFLWDSPVVKYKVTEDCDLMEVGQPFDSKNYGIGVPLGAPYRDDLTMVILKLSESGRLHEMQEKWWRNTRCPELRRASAAKNNRPLTIDKVAGVFMILAVGVVLSIFVSILEYLYNRYKDQRLERKKRREKKSTANATPAEKAILGSNVTFEPTDVDNFTHTGSRHTNIF